MNLQSTCVLSDSPKALFTLKPLKSATMVRSNPVEEVIDRRPLHSINDYSNDEDAEAALNLLKYPQLQQPSLVDWIVNGSLEPTSKEAAVKRELRRLNSLKSFQILDDEINADNNCYSCRKFNANGTNGVKDPAKNGSQTDAGDAKSTEDPVVSALNRVVDMATMMFNVPTAVISVTDMERQKVLAAKGFDESDQELPRSAALGACIVASQEDAIVVPDLAAEEKFQHLHIGSSRFYASVPLIAPDGERIGALCAFDTDPRPEGLNKHQLKLFQHLGELTMQSLLERRTRLRLTERLNTATKVVSSTVHDLLTPLTAIELAVSLLHEDHDFQSKLSEHQKESVKIASNCVGVLGQSK